ncbi:protein of unknown function [Chitinasiproducens palmae]|uniref:FecR N-terminal domain-containing protein n=2 Tax=Chitinasiproducens palmae TaxID=1770053 RepID=A0A1H2PJZ2_9BURK|nr:protein of unknown function [Chitinasiproducens palmae]
MMRGGDGENADYQCFGCADWESETQRTGCEPSMSRVPSGRSVIAASASGCPPEAIDQALAWLLRMGRSNIDPVERGAFQAWRHAKPENERAWMRVILLCSGGQASARRDAAGERRGEAGGEARGRAGAVICEMVEAAARGRRALPRSARTCAAFSAERDAALRAWQARKARAAQAGHAVVTLCRRVWLCLRDEGRILH